MAYIPPCIYIIAEGDAGPCKIGYATDVAKRLGTLQSGNPRQLTLAFSAPTMFAVQIEAKAHERLRDQRLIGEWFSVSVEQARAMIRAIVDEMLGSA